MDAVAEQQASEKLRIRGTSRYVVQRAVRAELDGSTDSVVLTAAVKETGIWQDMATVEVLLRSHRKTVIERALADLDVQDEDLPQLYRALDLETAEAIPVRLEKPEVPVPPAVRRIG
jgi:hypothetical protein